MIEREESLEPADLTDGERRAIFFSVGQALVGASSPRNGMDFDENQLTHVARRPYYGEVWTDLLEVYRHLQGVVSVQHTRDVLDDARERPGVPVEIEEGQDLVPARIIAVVGYHPRFPDALTGIAVMGHDDMEAPVMVWPQTSKVTVLQTM